MLATRLNAAGAYGKVTASAVDPNRAIKRTKLFDNNTLIGANVAEAAMAIDLMRNPKVRGFAAR